MISRALFVNLTVGVGGLLDPATQAGLDKTTKISGKPWAIGASIRAHSSRYPF